MSIAIPDIARSIKSDVGAAEADNGIAMAAGTLYEFACNTACWIKQGKAWTLTCATKANTAAGDYFTVQDDGGAVYTFQLDVSGTDRIAAGATRIDISSATTAAQVAALVKTALDAVFTSVTTTDNSDGTLTLLRLGAQLALTEHVAHASFTVANSTALAATLGSGSMFVPAGVVKPLDGKAGQTLSVIRDAADGKCTVTPLRFAR